MNKLQPSVIYKNIKYSGKWLEQEEIVYRDHNGKMMSWENVKRKNNTGAAVIIAKLKQSNRLLLIRQYRPPLDNFIIEFPAGLIDQNENVKMTALRELKEETGYTGVIISVSYPVFSSPGLTDESLYIVKMEIDELLPENFSPKQNSEPTENIEVLYTSESELNQFLKKRADLGDSIDSKVAVFAIGLGLSDNHF